MSETSRWKKILPELLAVILCLGVLCVGVSLKEGYHMDELLSFELADARYNPWIVPTQPEGRLAKFVREEIQGDSFGETLMNLKSTVTDVLKNRGSSKLLSYKADVYEEPDWITSGQFRDYVTVDGSDAFDYLSVYFNVKDDNHPPVHFMLLHTMSSLFPGTLSPWLGCTINLICVGITLWLLLRLGRQLSEIFGMEEQGRLLGILAVLLYGLSTGALASVLLIRMYCLLSCLCVALLSMHVEKWKEHGFDRSNKGLIAITVLGFLTQYFFLFYCILLAAVTAAGLLCSKRMRELWIYIRSMVVAAVIGLVLFPFAIADVFSSGRGVEALDNLTSGFAGYGARLLAFARILDGGRSGTRGRLRHGGSFGSGTVVSQTQRTGDRYAPGGQGDPVYAHHSCSGILSAGIPDVTVSGGPVCDAHVSYDRVTPCASFMLPGEETCQGFRLEGTFSRYWADGFDYCSAGTAPCIL